VNPFQRASYDIVWVLDSNVHVQPGTLARSVEALTRVYPEPSAQPNIIRSQFRPRIGVVHHVPFAKVYGAKNSLGSRVEAAFLNTNHAKMYIAINRLVLDSCVMGKSNMYRRSDVAHLTGLPSSRNQYKHQKAAPNGEAELPRYPTDVVTGLPAFADYLAEDNMIASSMMHELGLLHDTSCDIAINGIGEMSFFDYVERRVRWIRVRRHMVLSATIIEPFTECLVLCLIGMFSVGSLFRIPPLVFTVMHIAAWLSVDLGVYAALAGHPLPASEWWSFIGAWAIREVASFPIWVMGIVGNEVTWRGVPYTMLRNGQVRRREEKEPRNRDYTMVPSDV
jgi:ceramide glucosyltransferase